MLLHLLLLHGGHAVRGGQHKHIEREVLHILVARSGRHCHVPTHHNDSVVEQLIPRHTFTLINHQHALEQIPSVLAHRRTLRHQIIDLLGDLVEQLEWVGLVPRVMPKQHEVEGHAQRPNVSQITITLLLDDLGTHEQGRPAERLESVLGAGVDHLGQPKIGDLDDAIVKQDVLGFDVAVHDLSRTDVLESLGDLAEVAQHLLLGELLLVDLILNRTLITQLRDEVHVVIVLLGLDERHDVLVLQFA